MPVMDNKKVYRNRNISHTARGCNRMRFYRILVAAPFKYDEL